MRKSITINIDESNGEWKREINDIDISFIYSGKPTKLLEGDRIIFSWYSNFKSNIPGIISEKSFKMSGGTDFFKENNILINGIKIKKEKDSIFINILTVSKVKNKENIKFKLLSK